MSTGPEALIGLREGMSSQRVRTRCESLRQQWRLVGGRVREDVLDRVLSGTARLDERDESVDSDCETYRPALCR